MKDSQPSDPQTPYRTPQSDLEQLKSKGAEYGEFKLFSIKGRVGRVRYLLYFLLPLGILGQITFFLSGNKTVSMFMSKFGLPLIGGVFLISIGLVLTVQRLHDFNISGLFILLLGIPLINILFFLSLLFVSGTDGPNRFGPPGPPNKPIEKRLVIGGYIGIWLISLLLHNQW